MCNYHIRANTYVIRNGQGAWKVHAASLTPSHGERGRKFSRSFQDCCAIWRRFNRAIRSPIAKGSHQRIRSSRNGHAFLPCCTQAWGKSSLCSPYLDHRVVPSHDHCNIFLSSLSLRYDTPGKLALRYSDFNIPKMFTLQRSVFFFFFHKRLRLEKF